MYCWGIKLNTVNKKYKSEAGVVTLLELLAGILIASVMLLVVVSTFVSSTRNSQDVALRAETLGKASSIMDLITFDLRLAGIGMPLTQADFSSSDVTLGNVVLPVLPQSDADTIVYRFNESGYRSYLKADYSPTIYDLEFLVQDSSIYAVDDIIYISDFYTGGESGLYGTVTGISGDEITIDTAFKANLGATFVKASTVEPVKEVIISSSSNPDLITREADGQTVLIGRNTAFSLRYLDESGIELTLPMAASVIEEQLAIVEVTLDVVGTRLLTGGREYRETLIKQIALRNMRLARQ